MGANRLDVFGIDAATDQLAHWWWDGAWGGPQVLGGALGSDVSAVSWGPNRLDVFAVVGKSGGQLAHWWSDGAWHGPQLLGGNLNPPGTAPSAVSWAPIASTSSASMAPASLCIGGCLSELTGLGFGEYGRLNTPADLKTPATPS